MINIYEKEAAEMIFSQPWLCENEVLMHRMKEYHRGRVEALGSGNTLLTKQDGGILLINIFPISVVRSCNNIEWAKLINHGVGFTPPGSQYRTNPQSNLDGMAYCDGYESHRSYIQIFRNGSLEAAMSDVGFSMDRMPKGASYCIRDSICEKAVIDIVGAFMQFCTAVGLEAPVWVFSALLNCKGFCISTGISGRSPGSINYSPAFLPEIEIVSLDADPTLVMRPWCDILW